MSGPFSSQEPPLSTHNILIVCAFALSVYANIDAKGRSALAWAATLISVALLLPLVN